MVLNADLLKQLFGASTLDEVSEDRINILIEQYPYFAHLHWLSAIKKWNYSHDQHDLQSVGAYTFNPFRFKQYYTETPSQIADKPVENEILGRKEEERLPEQPTQISEAEVENKSESSQEETYSGSVIQPLFTQDYFAFTGAKLPDQIENDKKPTMDQLRSFTGWLRTMKRSVANSVDPDLGQEKINSNSGESQPFEHEAVTETMAEVRASMGHFDKAIAIYEKLSLSNPEKSAYFAQKIEALKNK